MSYDLPGAGAVGDSAGLARLAGPYVGQDVLHSLAVWYLTVLALASFVGVEEKD